MINSVGSAKWAEFIYFWCQLFNIWNTRNETIWFHGRNCSSLYLFEKLHRKINLVCLLHQLNSFFNHILSTCMLTSKPDILHKQTKTVNPPRIIIMEIVVTTQTLWIKENSRTIHTFSLRLLRLYWWQSGVDECNETNRKTLTNLNWKCKKCKYHWPESLVQMKSGRVIIKIANLFHSIKWG